MGNFPSFDLEDFLGDTHMHLLEDMESQRQYAQRAFLGKPGKLVAEVQSGFDAIRERILGSSSWQTARGEVLTIPVMDMSHIENCVNLLRRSLVETDSEIKRIAGILVADPTRLEYHTASLALLANVQVATEAQIKRFIDEMDKRENTADFKKSVRMAPTEVIIEIEAEQNAQ